MDKETLFQARTNPDFLKYLEEARVNSIKSKNGLTMSVLLKAKNIEWTNIGTEVKEKDIMDFFVLICFAFNHQIRFNNSHQFNTPFGKERSSYNRNIENNLILFCDAIH